MTHARLVRELAPGELAYWRAALAIEGEQYEQAREEAKRKAESERKNQEVLSGVNRRTLDKRPS
jgi:hypothetical protein